MKESNKLFIVLDNKENRIKIASFIIILLYILLYSRILLIYFESNRRGASVKNFAINSSGTRKHNILDTNDNLLATSVDAYNFYILPSKTVFVKETVEKISKLFPEINSLEVMAKIENRKNRLILIKKEITNEQKNAIIFSGIEAAEFEKVYSRVYPYGNLFSHIIGFVNSNLEGVYGIERSFNNELYYKDIKTSLNANVQTTLHASMAEAAAAYNTESAFGIVSNLDTGEILGIVSLPDFNPKKLPNITDKNMINNAVSSVYHLGSVFKIINVAMGIENGIKEDHLFKVDQKIQVDKTFAVKDERIRKAFLTPSEILAFSSNVGTVLILEEAGGVEKQRNFFELSGVFSPPKIELSPYEIAVPLFKSGNWEKSVHYTASYGYGIALSPIHFLQIVSPIVSDGKKRSLTLLKNKDSYQDETVVSLKTSESMRNILQDVVKIGTAKLARVNGYDICGKTSTSLKYNKKLKKWTNEQKIVSFFAFFPCKNPQYAIYLGFDGPKKTKTDSAIQGGTVAAPVVANIISEIAPLLNIKPDTTDH